MPKQNYINSKRFIRMFAIMKDRGLYFFLVIVCLIAVSCGNDGGGATEADGIYNEPALAELNKKIKENPDNDRLYYERGIILHKLAQNDNIYDSLAIEDFKKAISIDSNKAEYYSAVGDILFEHKDISGSVNWLEKAVQINPEDPRAHMKIAKMFVYLKEYPKAFAEINTVLRQDVYNPEGYFLKGLIYKDLKDTAKAISSFQTAVQVEPKYRPAIVQLGLLYGAKKDPLALQYMNNAYRLDTTDVFPIFAKGVYYQNLNEYEKAKNAYKEAILYDPQYADAYFNTGWILMQQDSLEKAWRQYDLVTRIQPDNAAAYYNRGLLSELMDKKQDAVKDYKQALTFDPEYEEARQGLERVEGAK